MDLSNSRYYTFIGIYQGEMLYSKSEASFYSFAAYDTVWKEGFIFKLYNDLPAE